MNGEVHPGKVMRLRFVQFLRGKSLVRLVCALAVAMASVLHVDAVFASSPANCVVFSASQDDDQGTDDQLVSERCHFCSVTAMASFVTPAAMEATCPTVPSGRARRLIAFQLPTTAPPPRT